MGANCGGVECSLSADLRSVWAEDRLDKYAREYHEYEQSKENDTPILKYVRDTQTQKVFKDHMNQIREEQQRDDAKNIQESKNKN